MGSTYTWNVQFFGASEGEKLASVLDRLDKSLSRLTRAGNTAGQSTRQFSSSTASGSSSLGKYAAAAGAAGAAVAAMSGVMRVATAVFGKITDLSAKAAGALKKYGAEASTSRAALTAFFGASSRVEKSVERLARTTEYTQKNMADFAISMKRAGADAGTIADIMPEVVKASRASGDSMAALGKTASNSLNQFSKSSETAADHLGNLVATANSTATSTGALRQGLSNAATAANILGISGKDTLTMLGQLANAGLEGSKSGRSLRIAFERLSAPTADASKTLQKLGIDLKSLNLSDPAEWLQVFGQRMAGLEGADRIAALKPIFGASASALAVLIEQSAGFDGMRQQIAGAREEIERFSQLRGESLMAAIDGWGSAIEGFWKAASKVTNPLWTAFYNAASNALNKVTNGIDKVAARFTDAGNDLKSWLDVLKSGGIRDLFSGLADALQPEIESIKQLAEAAFYGLRELLTAAIEGVDWEKLLKPLFEIGKKIGGGIASGISEYAPQAASAAEDYIDSNAPAPVRAIKAVGKSSWGNYKRAVKWGSAAVRGIAGVFGGDDEEQIDVDPAIRNAGSMPATPSAYPVDSAIDRAARGKLPQPKAAEYTVDGRPMTPEQIAKDAKLKEYAAWSKSQQGKDVTAGMSAAEKQAFYTRLNVEGMKNARKQGFEGLDDESLQRQKDELSKTAELNQSKADIRRAEDEIRNAPLQAEIDFSGWAESIEKYLVRPIDAFQAKVNQVKETFGAMLDNLKSKKINLSEKFGLTSTEDAAKQRQDVLAKANRRDEKLLDATADPAKKAEIEQRMAERLEQQADAAQGPEKQRLAKEAAGMLDKAETSTETAQEDELERIGIEKKHAEQNVGRLEQMLGQTEDAGVRDAINQQLSTMYQALGEREKLNAMMPGAKEDAMQAAIESAEQRAMQLEIARASLEQLQRQTSTLERILSEADIMGAIPEDPAFGMV